MSKAKRINEINGQGSFQKAQHMARFGHSDWIWWHDSEGSHAARKTPETVKQMLLKVGTKGEWALITASDGCPLKGFWALGINALRWMRVGGPYGRRP